MNYIPQLLSIIQALFCPALYRSHVKLCLQLCWMPYRQAENMSCLDENLFALFEKIWQQQFQLNQTRHTYSITCSHRTRMDLPSKPLPHFLLLNTPSQAKSTRHPGLVDPNHRTPNFMWKINLSVSSDLSIWTKRVCPGQSSALWSQCSFREEPQAVQLHQAEKWLGEQKHTLRQEHVWARTSEISSSNPKSRKGF